MASNLLTDDDVAERLRCSASKVRKLRYAGRLAFIPGRPPLIRERDFEAFLETERCQHLRSRGKAPKHKEPAKPIDELEQARIRARKTWILRKVVENNRKRK